jgi:hypothetical protein
VKERGEGPLRVLWGLIRLPYVVFKAVKAFLTGDWSEGRD